MSNETKTQTINGHKVTIGHNGDYTWFIQIDDGPKWYGYTGGDHWGSIGIDNPDDYKDTIVYQFIDEDDEGNWYFDMGGVFVTFDENGEPDQIDDYDVIIEPLGMKDNYNGSYGNG